MRLSIIIPICYELEMKTCLDSILGCPMQDMECILVDTLQTEKTKEIIAEYMSRDSRFKVIGEANASINQARNRGLTEAIGTYLFFLDVMEAFDILSWPTVLKDIDKSKDDFIAYCYYRRYDAKRDSKTQFSLTENLKSVEKIKQLLYSSHELNSCKGKLFRREILIKDRIFFSEQSIVLEEFSFIKEYLSKVHTARLSQVAVYNKYHQESPVYKLTTTKYLKEFEVAYHIQRLLVMEKSDPDLIGRFYLHYVWGLMKTIYDYSSILSPNELKETESLFGKSEVVTEILESASKDTIRPVSLWMESNRMQRKWYGWLGWYFRRKRKMKEMIELVEKKLWG